MIFGPLPIWQCERTSGSISTAASARCSPSRRTTPIAFAAWSAPIPSRLTRTNGCMRPSKSDAFWFAMPPLIGRASRWHRNIWKRHHAASRPAEWLYEYGLQTSRGFRALKVWMALKEQGVEKFGRLIDQNIAQAHYLDKLIASEPLLESVARTTINIVCFRYRPPGLDEPALKRLNVEIMLRLQEDGVAAISDTTVHGKHCLRVAINNHRTRRSDLDLLVREVLRLGRMIGN